MCLQIRNLRTRVITLSTTVRILKCVLCNVLHSRKATVRLFTSVKFSHVFSIHLTEHKSDHIENNYKVSAQYESSNVCSN